MRRRLVWIQGVGQFRIDLFLIRGFSSTSPTDTATARALVEITNPTIPLTNAVGDEVTTNTNNATIIRNERAAVEAQFITSESGAVIQRAFLIKGGQFGADFRLRLEQISSSVGSTPFSRASVNFSWTNAQGGIDFNTSETIDLLGNRPPGDSEEVNVRIDYPPTP